MKNPKIHAIAVALAIFGQTAPALAAAHDDVPDPAYVEIVNQLRDEGFIEIEVVQTFLGRFVITAEKGGQTREIVMTGSGEILRSKLFGTDAAGGEFGSAVSEAAEAGGAGFGASVAESASGGGSAGGGASNR